jgi:hypothetical protein
MKEKSVPIREIRGSNLSEREFNVALAEFNILHDNQITPDSPRFVCGALSARPFEYIFSAPYRKNVCIRPRKNNTQFLHIDS